MKTALLSSRTAPETRRAGSTTAKPGFFANAVLARLRDVGRGALLVRENGREHRFGSASAEGPDAELVVHDDRFWKAIALRGSIGAGEAYAYGWWSSPDAVAVIRLFVRNQDVLSGVESGLARLSRPLLAGYHALRRNSERQSRDNIMAHYDLSNDFFALFLDETMTYSSGIFDTPQTSLRDASVAKIDRLCQKLELGPEDHLVEIGTGWGAFALHAAKTYGCRVTTTTISKEQHDFAAARFAEAGLQDRIDLRFEDYRRLSGRYDKLVSVEMIEAVGHQYFDAFFESCANLLKPAGRMLLQAITIADQHYERAKTSVDFIQRHIFPGSCIPSVTALCSAATGASDLRLLQMEAMGTHYVRTLQEWRRNLAAHADEARAMGFDDVFLRLWDFYFVYCEGGFAERHIDVVQMEFAKPGARGEQRLPALTPLAAGV